MIRLEGKKVLLRDITAEDLERLYYYEYVADDREHQNWNGPYYPRTPMTQDEYVASKQGWLRDAEQNRPRSVLGIEIDGELRGTVTRYWVDEVTNWMETGIVIYDSSYWSGGYGTEAFAMWIGYLFGALDVVRLGIATWSGNERMMKLAACMGMVEEARVRKARIVRGDFYDAIKMGILREEWENQHNR
jgi:RimJ/RimL family protein N-acetyltransferase